MRIIKLGFICLLNLAALAFFIYHKFDVYPRAYLVWFYLIILSYLWYTIKDKREKEKGFEVIMTLSFVAIAISLIFNFAVSDENRKSEFHFTADDDINPEIIKTEVNKYHDTILIDRREVLEPEHTRNKEFFKVKPENMTYQEWSELLLESYD